MIKESKHYCDLPKATGDFRMYDSGSGDVLIVTYGGIYELGDNPLLRVQSSCHASELFQAIDCDCADQLQESMQMIAEEGKGMIVHLHQEGRGQGLTKKIKAVRLMQTQKCDTHEAFETLGYKQDIRQYDPVTKLLDELNIKKVRLISNNPRKRLFLERHGIVVEIVNTHPNIRPENQDYLASKNAKLGHNIPLNTNCSGPIQFYHSAQPWGELSNFSRHAVFLKNKIWPTVEHFYQAQKFAGTEIEEFIRLAETPTRAKERAKNEHQHIQKNWSDMKEKVMLEGLRAKFSQHPNLGKILVSTRNRKITEHTVNDSYWGDGRDNSGKNRLGKLIMLVRSELIA